MKANNIESIFDHREKKKQDEIDDIWNMIYEAERSGKFYDLLAVVKLLAKKIT